MGIEELRAYGANVDEGLGRCMGMEALYLRLVASTGSDANFDRLSNALAAGDLDTAFEASHALKGVLANLALTPLTEPMSELCELLRARTEMDYAPLMATIEERRAELLAL